MERELKKRGVTVLTGTTVERLERSPTTITAHLKDGTQVAAEKLLVSVGRGLNSRGIGLEQVGVQTGRRGEILVNERMETTVPGIYAIGDVVGKVMLAHVASAQGKVAVENIMGHQATVRYDVIPAGIFTLPEIGRVGVTEQQARERVQAAGQNPDRHSRWDVFDMPGWGRRKRQGIRRGCSRSLPSHRAEKFLGVHIVGAHAADLVHEAAMAMQVGATVTQMAEMIHAHPTLSEGLMEAAEDVEGKAIHQARKRTQ